MKVLVYVEGPSDVFAMQSLLAPLIDGRLGEGIRIEFYAAAKGNRKQYVVTEVPRRAASILRNDPEAFVVALPDLYPRNVGCPHETIEQLEQGVQRHFGEALRGKPGTDDPRLHQRFRVFCFKHDLEALLLAAPRQLAARLSLNSLSAHWRVPVEDQDQDTPPKRVVERLFEERGMRYSDTIDAPVILGQCDYLEIARACPQSFGPFVEFLTNL